MFCGGPGVALLRAAPPDDRLDGLKHDEQVEAKRLVLEVVQIV
jgi:hypothetical protein